MVNIARWYRCEGRGNLVPSRRNRLFRYWSLWLNVCLASSYGLCSILEAITKSKVAMSACLLFNEHSACGVFAGVEEQMGRES